MPSQKTPNSKKRVKSAAKHRSDLVAIDPRQGSGNQKRMTKNRSAAKKTIRAASHLQVSPQQKNPVRKNHGSNPYRETPKPQG